MREQIKQEKPVTDIDFIQVSCHPLVSDLNHEVEAWMSIIGKTMHEGAKQQAMALNDAIADRIAKLGRSAKCPLDNNRFTQPHHTRKQCSSTAA